jgi:hypothetical protein
MAGVAAIVIAATETPVNNAKRERTLDIRSPPRTGAYFFSVAVKIVRMVKNDHQNVTFHLTGGRAQVSTPERKLLHLSRPCGEHDTGVIAQ